MIKFEIGHISKEYCRGKSVKEKTRCFHLYRLLCDMQDSLIINSNPEMMEHKVQKVKAEIDAYDQKDTDRAIFRCKQKWHDEGE